MGTRHHRLPRKHYQGRVSAAFTLCLQDRRSFFVDPAIVQVFVEFLRQVADRHTFWVIYCFMPDHAYLIFMGRANDSDVLQGVEDFKQATGYWLEANYFLTSWQKSFHDGIIRARELGFGIRYVLGNPVREGLVSHWREYPFLGAIGLDLETFLEELGPD